VAPEDGAQAHHTRFARRVERAAAHGGWAVLREALINAARQSNQNSARRVISSDCISVESPGAISPPGSLLSGSVIGVLSRPMCSDGLAPEVLGSAAMGRKTLPCLREGGAGCQYKVAKYFGRVNASSHRLAG
jgi:hypothetical protein